MSWAPEKRSPAVAIGVRRKVDLALTTAFETSFKH
jgi:hypothetical protein